MKTIAYALTVLTLAAGAASAASMGVNERPGMATSDHVAQTEQVAARTVMTPSELARAGLSADDLLTVTKISGDTRIATNNSDR